MKTLENKKVYVGKYSKEIQLKAFEYGYTWEGNGNLGHNQEPFLYFNNGKIRHGNDVLFFNNSDEEEITPEEILAMEEVKEEKTIYDLEIGDSYYCIDYTAPEFSLFVKKVKIRDNWGMNIYNTQLIVQDVFLTKEEAKEEIEKKKALLKIHKYCHDNGISREYNSNNYNDYVFYINYNNEIDCNRDFKNGNVIGYFTESNAQKIKEIFEKEINLILK